MSTFKERSAHPNDIQISESILLQAGVVFGRYSEEGLVGNDPTTEVIHPSRISVAYIIFLFLVRIYFSPTFLVSHFKMAYTWSLINKPDRLHLQKIENKKKFSFAYCKIKEIYSRILIIGSSTKFFLNQILSFLDTTLKHFEGRDPHGNCYVADWKQVWLKRKLVLMNILHLPLYLRASRMTIAYPTIL